MTSRLIRVGLVFYRDDATAGGSLRVGESIANHLNSDDMQVHLLFAYGGPGPVTANTHAPCHFLRSKSSKDVVGWFRARAFVATLRLDILHFIQPVLWLQMALSGMNYAKVIHMHGIPGPALPSHGATMSLVEQVIASQVAGSADLQICITTGTKEALIGLGWGDPSRMRVVYNAIDTRYFEQRPSHENARATLVLPPTARIMGMVCRLVPYRGCDDALRLLGLLHSEWHLLLCGDGPFRGELERQAFRLGLRERVHFTGNMTDVRPAYAAMDLFLMLARYETFGLAICEAMASGVPVFGLRGEGNYDEEEYPLVTDENSVFIPRAHPADYDAPEDIGVIAKLADRITRIMPDVEILSAMRDRAALWVKSRFDAEVQARAMMTIYREVIAEHGRD